MTTPSCELTRVFLEQLPALQQPFDDLQAAKDVTIADITVGDVLNRGLRGLPTLLTNVSTVSQDRGLIIRGYELPELVDRHVLDLTWMGLTGLVPEPDQRERFAEDLNQFAEIPAGLREVMDALGCEREPIMAFSHSYSYLAVRSAVADTFCASPAGRVRKAVHELEHVKRIVALSLPLIGLINSQLTGQPQRLPIDWRLGWGVNLCRALNVDERRFGRLLEVYGLAHFDQGKGNPSSHVSHIVSTTGADPYRCVAASLIALSCPSHAFAGVGFLRMLDEIEALYDDPTEAEVRSYLTARLRNGERIYGVGQAVMKNVDTRFLCLQREAESALVDDRYYRMMGLILATIGDAFEAAGNRKIVPNPNVNMVSSIILSRLMGVERAMLPLLFASSRIIGNLCQYIEGMIRPARVCRPLSYNVDEVRAACRGQERGRVALSLVAGASRG